MKSLSLYIQKFRTNCIARNLSNDTIVHYSSCLKLFNQWIDKKQVADLEDIDADIVEAYLAQRSKEVSKCTVRHDYLAIHVLFKYLVKRKVVEEDPTELIDKPKLPKRELHAFTPKEINSMLSYFDRETFLGMRNYLIMCFLFSTGVRVSEMLNLTTDDIDMDTLNVKIIGKGDKERNIPLTEELCKVIRRYLKKRKEYTLTHKCNSAYIFISRTGLKLDKNNVEDIFRKMKQDIGINGTPHTWRHSYAKFYLTNGGDMVTLQKIMGHARITTTRQYINMDGEDVDRQNRKYNPFTNRKWDI